MFSSCKLQFCPGLLRVRDEIRVVLCTSDGSLTPRSGAMPCDSGSPPSSALLPPSKFLPLPAHTQPGERHHRPQEQKRIFILLHLCSQEDLFSSLRLVFGTVPSSTILTSFCWGWLFTPSLKLTLRKVQRRSVWEVKQDQPFRIFPFRDIIHYLAISGENCVFN